MSDENRNSELEKNERGLWGDVFHSDGSKSRIDSTPYPDSATNSDGKRYIKDVYGHWHPVVEAPDYKYGSGSASTTSGNTSFAGFSVPSIQEPRPAVGLAIGLLILIITMILHIYQRTLIAVTSFPVATSVLAVAALATGVAMYFLEPWRKLLGLAGLGSCLTVAAAWIYPNQFGVAGIPILIANALNWISKVALELLPWTAIWFAILLGLLVLFVCFNYASKWDSWFGVLCTALVATGVIYWAAEPAIQSAMSSLLTLDGLNHLTRDGSGFVRALFLGFFTLICASIIFYGMEFSKNRN